MSPPSLPWGRRAEDALVLHLHPQRLWHDPVFAVGSPAALEELAGLARRAASSGSALAVFAAGDGEPYPVGILCHDGDWSRELLPYSLPVARDERPEAVRLVLEPGGRPERRDSQPDAQIAAVLPPADEERAGGQWELLHVHGQAAAGAPVLFLGTAAALERLATVLEGASARGTGHWLFACGDRVGFPLYAIRHRGRWHREALPYAGGEAETRAGAIWPHPGLGSRPPFRTALKPVPPDHP